MRRTWIALALALALVAAACSDDAESGSGPEPETSTTGAGSDDATTDADADADADAEDADAEDADADGEAEGAFPVSVATAGGEVTISERPQRIVSLSPTATEMLYAVGAGDQVLAVDDQSDFPADVPATDLSGFEPNLEAIAGYEPDLVVISFDPGELATGLGEIGIPVLNQPPATSLDEAYAQIEQLGAATGNLAEATQVVADMQAAIDEAVAGVDRPEQPLSVYHELDGSFFSAASSTFIGELYQLLGLDNIVDEADTDGFGYPQLNPEYIIEADPDLIVITDEVGYGIDEVKGRPGWNAVSAVAHDDVIQVDSDLASRWGPRVVEFVEQVADHVATMEPADA